MTAFDPQRLLRPDVADMEEYTPIQPFEVLSRRLGIAPGAIVKLDANENPYGPAPGVAEAELDADPEATLRDVARHRAQVLVAVPVMLQRILELPAHVRRRFVEMLETQLEHERKAMERKK